MEVHTPTGRVDIVMKTDKALYLFELKLKKTDFQACLIAFVIYIVQLCNYT